MALTEMQLKICRFHGSLSQKGSWPMAYYMSSPSKYWKLKYVMPYCEIASF